MTIRHLHFITLLLAAIMFAGCKSDELPDVEPTRDILDCFDADGNAWISLQIDMGGGFGTRALTYQDGSSDEQDVKNATLILFHKGSATSEDNYEVASVYRMGNDYVSLGTGETQVEKYSQTITRQINRQNLTEGDNVYLLLVLNDQGNIGPCSGYPLDATIVTDGGTTTANLVGKTFAEVKKCIMNGCVSVLSSGKLGGGGIMMTNSPISKLPGGDADPSGTGGEIRTLVEIPANRIYKKEQDALDNKAAVVYVERAAAKISAYANGDPTAMKIEANTSLTIAAMDVALDNFNTNCYLTRQFTTAHCGLKASKATGDNQWRMAEKTALGNSGSLPNAFGTGETTAYRTHWGEDINYDGSTGLSVYNVATATAPTPWADFHAIGQTEDKANTYYVAENTFDVDHMTFECSTQLIIRLKIGTGDFYTISTTEDIYKEPENKFEELGTGAGKSFAPQPKRAPGDPSALDVYLRDWLMAQVPAVKTWVDTYAGGNKTHIVIEVASSFKGGKLTKGDLTVSQTACASGTTGHTKFEETPDGVKEKILNALEKLTISKYKDGYCYYRVPIRHFSDDETPWKLEKNMTSAATSLYGSNTANYLGRYGVVRNNWYVVEITGISRLGTPTLEELTTDGDDWNNDIVSLKISILPWYAHTQTE